MLNVSRTRGKIEVTKGVRVFIWLVGSYIVMASLLVAFVPGYAMHLMDQGLLAKDLNGFQKSLIFVGNTLKNEGLLFLPFVALGAAGIGFLVQRLGSPKQPASVA